MSSRDAVEFDKELHSLYETKLPISASKIQQLTRLALKHARNLMLTLICALVLSFKHYKNVVYSIEKFIHKCSADLKLAGLYVIDSIARASQKAAIGEGGSASMERFAYLARLEEKIEGIFPYLLSASDRDKEKMKKVVGLWKKSNLFHHELLEGLEAAYFPNGQTDAEGSPNVASAGFEPPASMKISFSSRRDPRKSQAEESERSTTPLGSPPPLPSSAVTSSSATSAPAATPTSQPGLDPISILTSLSTFGGGVLAPFLPSLVQQLQPLFGGTGDINTAMAQLAALGNLQGLLSSSSAQDPATVATLVALLGGGVQATPAPVVSESVALGNGSVAPVLPAVLGDFDYSDEEDDGSVRKPRPVSSIGG
ncbi:SR- and CTD-associated factor 8 [Dinochytrium kinnereticum]|nr:SR- and CTD-associated factor 8 [Dinochytrium kinnereticum]